MKTNPLRMTPLATILGTLFLLWVQLAGAAPTVYYDEAEYLAALADLHCTTIIKESFEGPIWDPARQQEGYESGITSQGVTWSAGDTLRVRAFQRTGTNGIYDSAGDPDHLSGGSITPLVAIGGWFRGTSASNLQVILGPTRQVASLDLAYYDFHFVGVIYPDGFGSFNFCTSAGHWGADDFTMGIAPVLPQLTVRRLNASTQVLSWSTNAPSCQLEYADNFPPTVWNVVTNMPNVSGRWYHVTPPIEGSQRFYRLRWR